MSDDKPGAVEDCLLRLGVFCHHQGEPTGYRFSPVQVERRRRCGSTRGDYHLVCSLCGVVSLADLVG